MEDLCQYADRPFAFVGRYLKRRWLPHLVILISVLGVMVPLVVSDLTRGTGRFNLALGAVGTAMGIGAALSTSLAGIMADRLGSHAAFLGLAVVGLAAFLLVALAMPETRVSEPRQEPEAA